MDALMEKAYKICDDIYSRARELNLDFKTVSIQLILQDMSGSSRAKTFETPVENLDVLKNTAKELFQKLLEETPEELKARRLGVKISGFSVGRQAQRHITEFVED
jgi:nucleotidyltransferase/DNA polymerase involved in DNA repair